MTGLLQEAELAHRLSTLISRATGQTAEDEMIGLRETIDPHAREMIALGMIVFEDATTETTAATRIETEIVIGIG